MESKFSVNYESNLAQPHYKVTFVKNYKIFVQIASYRDNQLIPTIEDMLATADYPETLQFGICLQYDEEDDLRYFDNKPNIKCSKFHYTESKGLGWARNEANKLYNDEDFILQLDSHHRFVPHWDTILMEDFYEASTYSQKPILSTYCTPFNPTIPINDFAPCLMCQYEFSNDHLLMSRPYYIQDYKIRNKLIRARTLSCHFFFTTGDFIKEVPYDPDIYFGGYTEETTLSARAFTHGWDFFSPYRLYIWHEYTRSYRKKHWEDHQNWGERDSLSRNKTRELFGQEDHGLKVNESIHGLGKVRSLQDYEQYCGFDFKNKLIQQYTLDVKEPPNPIKGQFIEPLYCCDVYLKWDDRIINLENERFNEKPDFLALGIEDTSSHNIYRKDITPDANQYRVQFTSSTRPDKWAIHAHYPSLKWGSRMEGHF